MVSLRIFLAVHKNHNGLCSFRKTVVIFSIIDSHIERNRQKIYTCKKKIVARAKSFNYAVKEVDSYSGKQEFMLISYTNKTGITPGHHTKIQLKYTVNKSTKA